MITVDTSTITQDELEEKVLTMGQHVDQVLMRDSSLRSSAFVSDASTTYINVQLDKVNKQLSKLSAELLSSTSSNESESWSGGSGGGGRGGGRSGGGRGKRKKHCWNCGGDHHVLQCNRTILKEKEKGGHIDTFYDESAFFSEVNFSGFHVSKFDSSPEDLYLPYGDFESYNHNFDVIHHAAFSYTMSDNFRDHDSSFLRIGRCDSLFAELIDHVCLMAQIFTDSSIDTIVRDTGSERSDHMNRVECYANVDQHRRDFSLIQPSSCVRVDA
jgi:hypothetical protein